ncbi:MAG: PrsW family intramembrane metalloprotease [Clostridia bacterium]|nr:PrsW family intramembrane metalloprotease [Clostridia bacterium]
MSFETIILVITALVPAIALGAYVYIKDRAEKEPVPLLIGLFLSGIAIIPFVLLVSGPLSALIEGIFIPFATETEAGYELNNFLFIIYTAFDTFIGVALVEEGFKWLALLLITKKSKNFNSLFDGVIYAVFVSLGFAAAENVMYVLQNGMGNAVMRAVTAVPGHVFDAVIMGYFYSLWKIYSTADRYETTLQLQNPSAKEAISGKKYLGMSILMPVLAHGFYDFCCFMNGVQYLVIFIVFLVFLYIYCFSKINSMSKNDVSITRLAKKLFGQYHPEAVISAVGTPETAPQGAETETGSTPLRYAMPNGDVFVGNLDESSRPQGYGIYILSNGSKYEGFFQNGLFHGKGTLTKPDGSFYRGEWQDCKMHGSGIMTTSDGKVYSGTWNMGTFVGKQ